MTTPLPPPHIVPFRGTDIQDVTQAEYVDQIRRALADKRGGWGVTINLEILRQCTKDPALMELINEADVRVPDGITLVWASKLLGDPLRERVTGSDLIYSMSEMAAQEGYSIFLLGGDDGVAEKASAELQRRYPGLKVAGIHVPPFGFEKSEEQQAAMNTALSEAKPDIVFVALGFPKADVLTKKIRHLLPQAYWIGVGISFSFVAGEVSRAPKWVQKSGLESYHRLIQEPRLAKRYLQDGPPFAAKVLASSAFSGVMRRLGLK